MQNLNRVPVKKWRQWPDVAQRVFNKTYGAMTADPKLYWHPMAERVKPHLWKTTAWNAAWMAADGVVEALDEIIKEGEDA